MMERLEGYLDKRLALNTKTAKVIRFRKKEERIKKGGMGMEGSEDR